MRILAKRALRDFWKRHPKAKGPLEAWHQEVARADWATPSTVKLQFRSASILPDNRVVFNIAGNQYRLVAKINYPYRVVYIRFIGTHAAYDSVDATTIERYGGLMTIAPIKTARDYGRALRRIEQLMDAKQGTKAGDELDVLTTLVEAYEAKHHAICPPAPIEAIKFRMDQLGMTRKDLAAMLGGRGRVSEILTGKRSLSLEMIRRLHRKLHIPLESLIGTAA